MTKQKKINEMNRDELLVVVWDLINVIARKVSRDLQPNRAANLRHQRMKYIWGRKKLAMFGLLHKAVQHCPPKLAAEIEYVLNIEESHYQRRDAKVRRLLEAERKAKASQQNGRELKGGLEV